MLGLNISRTPVSSKSPGRSSVPRPVRQQLGKLLTAIKPSKLFAFLGRLTAPNNKETRAPGSVRTQSLDDATWLGSDAHSSDRAFSRLSSFRSEFELDSAPGQFSGLTELEQAVLRGQSAANRDNSLESLPPLSFQPAVLRQQPAVEHPVSFDLSLLQQENLEPLSQQITDSMPSSDASDLSPKLLEAIVDIGTLGSWSAQSGDLVPKLLSEYLQLPIAVTSKSAGNASGNTVTQTFGEHLPGKTIQVFLEGAHYSPVINGKRIQVPADGDCFFHSVFQAAGIDYDQNLIQFYRSQIAESLSHNGSEYELFLND